MVASSAGRVCIRRWFAAFRYTAAVLFKGAVHRKIKMTENVLTLRLSKIQMILLFMEIDLEKCIIPSLAHNAVNGCRQKESPNS